MMEYVTVPALRASMRAIATPSSPSHVLRDHARILPLWGLFVMTRTLRAAAFPAALLLLIPAAAPHDDLPLRGFTTASARIEREWEAKFRAIPEPARMREAMRRLTLRPHHLGSAYGKDNAEWLRAQYASYGFDATIERFDVLFPTPITRVLELVAPTRFTARLEEPALAEDPTSNQRGEQLPTYNA